MAYQVMRARTMDIVAWLRSLGLGKYEAIFREKDIDETVLSSLTHENLKERGAASLGTREAGGCHCCSAQRRERQGALGRHSHRIEQSKRR